MIVGTSYSPAKAFISFAREFIGALSRGDYGQALAGIDQNDDGTRWSKSSLEAALRALNASEITTPEGHLKSANPSCTTVEENRQFNLTHRLPLNGKWSNVEVLFVFTRKRGDYYRVQLTGFRRVS